MSSDQGVTRELGVGEVISKTFDLYRKNFVNYFVLFVIIEAIIGIIDVFAYRAFPLPTVPANATQQQILNWIPGYFGALFSLLAVVGVVTLVFSPIIYGSTIRMASDEITKGQADLRGSVWFAVSKIVWMWILGLLVGIIIGIGFVALVIPGIILTIMFCLVLPALLIENAGVIGSMNRSRELVGHRWLKTFAVLLLVLIILVVAGVIVNAISAPFGAASVFVTNVLSSFYAPILPISLTVYYYSNLARTSPQGSQVPVGQAVGPQPGMKFCPNCGTQLPSMAAFCAKCGAKQPT